MPMTFDMAHAPFGGVHGGVRRPAPSRRCSDSRCSGRDCLRASGARRLRSDADGVVANSTAAHQHAGRAKAALQAVILVKGVLHRMQRARALPQAFDRSSRVVPSSATREQRAALHRSCRRHARRRRRTGWCRSRHACRSGRASRAGDRDSSVDGSTSTLVGLPLRTKSDLHGVTPSRLASGEQTRARPIGQVASTTSPTPNGFAKNFRSGT